MRGLLLACLIALLLAAALSPALAQTGFDRPGGDYSNFAVTPAIRRPARRAASARGAAAPGASPIRARRRPSAMCWLKNRVTKRVEDSCCVSGVKGAGVPERNTGPIEFSIDRTGGDYRNMEVKTDATGAVCAQACEAEQRCRAWTYVRPGYLGASARCFLKERLTAPRRKPCCVSGVVR